MINTKKGKSNIVWAKAQNGLHHSLPTRSHTFFSNLKKKLYASSSSRIQPPPPLDLRSHPALAPPPDLCSHPTQRFRSHAAAGSPMRCFPASPLAGTAVQASAPLLAASLHGDASRQRRLVAEQGAWRRVAASLLP